ncbi:MAG TPA: hypothetical protein VF592_04475 [Sphingomonas sp.]|jgi:hypothetical protein|uniref:hypothetical protein n=1 Tax=Sphingomonas sp. TaxID=28214 RepID=UPI002EDA39CF
MRLMVVGTMLLALAACNDHEAERAAADARAANFTPPAVTSRLDWGGQQERRFTALDRNADGKLTDQEFPRVDSRLVRADANRDGEITKGEFTTRAMDRFDRMDLNRDGTVTSEEQETTRNGTLAVE